MCRVCELVVCVWCVGGGSSVFECAVLWVVLERDARVVWILEIPGPAAADEV